MGDPAAWLQQQAENLVNSLGYLGVALIAYVDIVLPPVPSEIVLPVAGFPSGRDRLSFPITLAAASAGALLGALTLYALGRAFGEQRLRHLLQRFGIKFLAEEKHLDRALAWFRRHGPLAILIGHMLPMVPPLISVPAGIVQMPLPRFILYAGIGIFIWTTALLGLGWLLGEQWEIVRHYLDLASLAFLVLALLVGGWFLWRATRASSRDAPAES